MKYLLFDENAVSTLISKKTLQSIEYPQGMRFVDHCCQRGQSEMFEDIAIEYTSEGVLFIGRKRNDGQERKIFCIDLTTCNIMIEQDNPANLLTLMQKSFRTVTRIWNRQPFSFSERVSGTKSIVFPYVIPDKRRIVIERSNKIDRLTKRGITFPLLAYKYCADDFHGEETVDTTMLKKAGEAYSDLYYEIQKRFTVNVKGQTSAGKPLGSATGTQIERREDFIYWDYNMQYNNLTEAQRSVVDSPDLQSPIRIDGAAGTGKTLSLIMRAYKLLNHHKSSGEPFKIIFFTHSQSTYKRNLEIFSMYDESDYFLNPVSQQQIVFIPLLDYCRDFANIEADALIERDAGDSKTFQLMLIEEAYQTAKKDHTIATYMPLVSQRIRELFENTPDNEICELLAHEFSVQIKGRTDGTIDQYYELASIKNGLPCSKKEDKELIFRIFNAYQKSLQLNSNYDVDDVVLEALSRLNAPVWRRERATEGYDYIIVDEMHLFNINEQSVFHFLTKDVQKKNIPICFALDYSQAVGDRGERKHDYTENAFGKLVEKKYQTVFRNSPQITAFCAAIAASGTLMFEESFIDPYRDIQYSFTLDEERKFEKPKLFMYRNDTCMIDSIAMHIDEITKALHCKPKDIVVVSFDQRFLSPEGLNELERRTKKQMKRIDQDRFDDVSVPVASPYEINGLEFQAVIVIGVDEGRVPQTAGTSDISQNFIRYSAYNMLYLVTSRAKYQLILLGSELNGQSSCLKHSIQTEYLEVIKV